MIIKCCNKKLLIYKMKQLIENIKDDELLEFQIIGNPIQKGTFNLKIKEFREDEKDKNSKILCFLFFGVCDKCNKIIIQGIHQEKIEPTKGIDYKIVNERSGEVRSFHFNEFKEKLK